MTGMTHDHGWPEKHDVRSAGGLDPRSMAMSYDDSGDGSTPCQCTKTVCANKATGTDLLCDACRADCTT
jgi:hypothetical protein